MLLFLGDIHGNFNYVKDYIKRNNLKDCTIYQVGDFGVGFTTEFNDMEVLNSLNGILKENNIQMYVIRGNHDNPHFFDGHLENYFENLHLLPDYSITSVNGVKILGVGGAVSIDRRPRLREMQEHSRQGRSVELHWEDEVFKLDEEKLKSFKDIDIVVTHTTPDFCNPINKDGFGYLVEQFGKYDYYLYDDLRNERDLLTKMWNILKENNNFTHWFYGHFHRSNVEKINGCDYIMLGINEFYDPKIDYIDELNKRYGK